MSAPPDKKFKFGSFVTNLYYTSSAIACQIELGDRKTAELAQDFL